MLVKYASALKTGTADADALLRRFTRSNLQHPTYQALHELGRVIKTIFLCDYLSDPRLRQEIQEALNVIEQWNSVNGFIFSTRGRELLSNRPEDQEIAVLSLHLIQVSLALINTLLLQDVLAEEQWKAPMKPEDWRGPPPSSISTSTPTGASPWTWLNAFLCRSPTSPRPVDSRTDWSQEHEATNQFDHW